MAIDFRADPIGPRTKGWKSKGPGKTRLFAGWEPMPQYGVGQEDLARHEWDDTSPAPAAATPPTDAPDAAPPPTPTPDLRRNEWPSTPAPAPNERRTTFPTQTVAPTVQKPYTDTGSAPLSSAPKTTPVTQTPSPSRTTTAPAPATSAPGAVPPSQGTTATGATGGTQSSNVAATPAPRSGSQAQFVQDMLPIAQRVSAATGIPWQVLIAIPANETGWGSAVFQNNYFGIKDEKNGQPARTWEEVNGAHVDITDNFATFSGAEESMYGFANFLHDNPRYADALNYLSQNPNDWPTFVSMVHQAGYATAHDWADKVTSIGRGLEQAYGDQGTNSPPPQTSQRGTGSVFNTANSATSASTGTSDPTVQGRPSQFSDPSIDKATADAICGPAAAIAFIRATGRNPTLKEAYQLASQRGDWSLDKGMHGVTSEQDLLAAYGVTTHIQYADKNGLDWTAVQDDIAHGNSVILDTPGHYYVVDGYNPQNGAYHVGTSGTDLIGGSDWMTPDQINSKYQSQGAVRAALHMDPSNGARPSVVSSTNTTSSTTRNSSQPVTSVTPNNRTPDDKTQAKKTQLDGAAQKLQRNDQTHTATNFVRWAYRNGLGVDLPDDPNAIFASSQPLDLSEARPGDVVVFNMSSDGTLEDAGIYAGGGKMLHDNGGGVEVKDIPNGALIRRVPGIEEGDLWSGSNGQDPPVKSVTPQGNGYYLVAFQDGSHRVMRPTQHAINAAPQAPQTVQPAPAASGMGHGQDAPGFEGFDPTAYDKSGWPSGTGMWGGQPTPQRPAARSEILGQMYPMRPWNVAPGATGTGQEQTKPTLSKKESSYTKRASEDFCKDCSMFRANACTLVKGYIHDKGSCDYFEPAKAGVGAGADVGGGDALDNPDEVADGANVVMSDDLRRLRGLPPNPPQPSAPPPSAAPAPTPAPTQGGGRLPRTPTQAPNAPQAPDLTQAPVLGGAIQATQAGAKAVQSAVQSVKPGDVPILGGAPSANLGGSQPPQFTPGFGYDPSHMRAQQGYRPELANRADMTPTQARHIEDEQAKATIAGAAVAGSLVAAPVVGAAAAPVLGARGAMLAGDLAANALPIMPDLVGNIHSGNMTGVKADLAFVGAGMIAGPVTERALQIAGALGDASLAPVIAKVSSAPGGEALIQMLADDAGSLRYGAIPGAVRTIAHPVGAVGRTGANILKGGVVGASVGAATQFAAEASDFATDNHWQDKNWWANVLSDTKSGGITGGVMGIGFGAIAAPLRWGWDHWVNPGVIEKFRASVLEPVRNIKIYDQHGNLDMGATLSTRNSLMQGINGDHQARVEADIVAATGADLFGPAGQGYNTAEALAYIEENQSLSGFNRTPYGKGLPDVTPEQAEWVRQRVRYEEDMGIKLRKIGALRPGQDVVSGVGELGPNVHVMHLFENDPNIPRGGSGYTQSRSWREGVTSARRKSTDTDAPEGTPATLRERLDERISDPVNNPEVHDSMVDSFEASTFQQERSFHRRTAWNELREGPATVTRDQARLDPFRYAGWKRAEEKWGFGQGADAYLFDPNVHQYLQNVTSDLGPWRNAFQWWGSIAKGTLFAGSLFHMWNIASRSMSLVGGPVTGAKDLGRFAELLGVHILPSLMPDGPRQMLIHNPDLYRRAAASGLTGRSVVGEALSRNPSWRRTLTMMGTSGLGFAAGGWLNAERQGMSPDQALQEAWKWGVVGAAIASPAPGLLAKGLTRGSTEVSAATNISDVLHEVIFNRVLPAAKVGSFDILTRAMKDDIARGKMSERTIAEQINNTLGGIDTVKMGRAPWVQDLVRFFSVAPDWEEGQIRQLFNVFSGGEAGKFTRGTVVRTVATYMGTIEMLNQLFNGHPTWQNGQGHQFELETTGMLDAVAQLKGHSWMRSIDPQTQRPQRTYADPLPSLRWIMQTLAEFSRYGANLGGQAETALGGAVGDQGMQQAGQTLQRRSYGDTMHGELPPNPYKTVAQDVSQRLGPLPNMLGAAGGYLGANPQGFRDWTGAGYVPPGMDTAPMWAKLVTAGAHVFAAGEPALGSTLEQKINLHDPAKTRWGDAFVEALGLTRVQAQTEMQENLTKQDQLLSTLGVSPDQITMVQDEHRKMLAQNDSDQQDVFARVASGALTPAAAESKLRDLSRARSELTRQKQLRMDYGSLIPAGPERERAIQFLMDIYSITNPSDSPADVDNKIDVNTLVQNYWNPPGIDKSDTTGRQRAQRALINDTAAMHAESPDALLDQVKWKSLHTDLHTGQTQAMPTLQGMSSDDLSEATTGYLQAGDDPKTGQRYEDPGVAADAQRTYLDNYATTHHVNVDNLQDRIRLRLSPVAQPNETQVSYENALQAYFDSRDNYKHPEYIGEDGRTLGTPQDWNGPPGHPELGWNLQLAALGAKAAKRSDLAPLLEAKQRGDQQRKIFLLTNQNNADWERWYGQQGRSMTNSQWDAYQANKTVGYKDLISNGGPADETKRRDKIREIYAAMSPQDQINNTVDVWQNGEYRSLTLRGAYHYILRQNVNGAGRTLLADEQQDLDALRAGTPGTPSLAQIASIGQLPTGP